MRVFLKLSVARGVYSLYKPLHFVKLVANYVAEVEDHVFGIPLRNPANLGEVLDFIGVRDELDVIILP